MMTHLAAWVCVALVALGTAPLVAALLQFAMVMPHRWRAHLNKVGDYTPNVAIIVPAWNEGAVIGTSLDRLLTLDYPVTGLRIYVVDDGSTDNTASEVLLRNKTHPQQVVLLSRKNGGQGKAHTLNHGLDYLAHEGWAEAVLIMDADVVYEKISLRKMTRHLHDPKIGSVTAYIKEGSGKEGNWMTRFIAYEYAAAQAASRRSQNVQGTLACLAGGAQLHTMENIKAVGGQIDVTTLAEDTVTTFLTQLNGRKAVFEPNAIVWAEEPGGIEALWKQRLRWSRGNVQVTRKFKHLWGKGHESGLGGWFFSFQWFSLLFQPVLMISAAVGLVGLYFIDYALAWRTFLFFWVINLVTYVFISLYVSFIDLGTAKRSWREIVFFPGAFSVAIIGYCTMPRVYELSYQGLEQFIGVHSWLTTSFMLTAYAWTALCMPVAYVGKVAEKSGRRLFRFLAPMWVYIGGYGPLLCAITFTSYIKEFQKAEIKWDKTEKTGKMTSTFSN